ncbi:exodeoxyribonuclease III [Zobellia galactanivorans]|uniref:Exodeoxyribonuclease III n=1 Tax=Zobellia galactanivorans (strain DSM 12802 / CCUG 47099 / CIP 106680 / NCIMB 13871 / Dsij) TaxID=63186 RepID=G0L3U9_ZOBGA|nr:exodeoxyribonuclease III [Zobellia galactanivorans]MDO6808341.1 exodeoxyribonuclease III [Zobellia galactanivorans]CAZ95473.1 Exodeoxyribonuclease III [Zobellia galactanivorans]
MKIISYNVNGIRAALNKGFLDWLQAVDPDVVCLQEIKAMEEQLDLSLFEEAGYSNNYWFSAQKKGYSGTAILSKKQPDAVQKGTGIDYMDFEGRNIRADFGDISIMSMYLPSGTNLARLEHKLMYMADFRKYTDELRKTHPNLIVLGDYNVCHQAIDIHDPVRNKNVSGFLPVEREWIGNFMDSGFIDSFRHFNKEPDNYTWWSYRANARNNNKGWRLDYGMVAEPLKDRLKRSVILSEAKHSDHCPILVEVETP